MRCPYCNASEEECVPDVVYLNAQSYGSGWKNFSCKSCGKTVYAHADVSVRIVEPSKTDADSDFFNG